MLSNAGKVYFISFDDSIMRIDGIACFLSFENYPHIDLMKFPAYCVLTRDEYRYVFVRFATCADIIQYDS